jgi:hypothetical protein
MESGIVTTFNMVNIHGLVYESGSQRLKLL